SSGAVFPVPSTMIVTAGQTSALISVTAGSPGDAFITASVGGTTASISETVVAAPLISSISSFSNKFQVGSIGTINLSFDAVLAHDTAITIVNSAPGVASIPAAGF